MNGKNIEKEFVKTFNNKEIKDLSIQQKCFIKNLFEEVNYNDVIICWLNKERKKADIFIKIGDLTQGISIEKKIQCIQRR